MRIDIFPASMTDAVQPPTTQGAVPMSRRTNIESATQSHATSSRRRSRRRRAAAIVVGAAIATCAFGDRADALSKSWRSTTAAWSSWNIGANWSPLGQPQDGDTVSIVNTAATERGVYYVNTMYPDAMLTTFTLDGIGGATMNFSQQSSSYFSLGATTATIGNNGMGSYQQSNGEFYGSELVLGRNAGSNGNYSTTGGELYSDLLTIGQSGNGTVTFMGGTGSVSSALTLGAAAGSKGT